MSLGTLDQKLWVALSCPVAGIEFDRKTLDFVDSDADGHIRAPEIIAAAEWAGKALVDPDFLVRRQDRLPLSSIDESTDEGKAVMSGVNLVLSALGKSGSTEITLEDASDTARIFSQARFNGDGIVPARAAVDPALTAAVEDIIACLGSQADRSGEPGVTAESISRFYSEAKALRDWWDAGRKPEIRPFGDDTAARYDLFKSLRPKIEDYFQRCRIAAYDGRSASLLGPADADYQKLSAENLGGSVEAVALFPIAVPAAGKAMPLSAGLNPAYSDAVRRFREEVVSPVLGGAETLGDEGWAILCSRFAPREAWLAAKPATKLEELGEERVRKLLAEDGEAFLGPPLGEVGHPKVAGEAPR